MKSRIKVAIVTQFPKDASAPHGGVEAVSVNLVRALASCDDLDLHVVTVDSACSAITHETWTGVPVHRLPKLRRSELVNAIGAGRRQVATYLSELSPDLVHAHDTYGLMVKGLPMPRVFTIHGFIYGDTLVSGKNLPWLRSRIWHWFETSCWADQPHIISISPYVRERLTGTARGIIHDIDNPISETFFDIARIEKKGVIFSAAVISPRKNTLILVEAFSRICAEGINAELRLAGKVVDEGYGASLINLIRNRGLENKVTLLGGISGDQVRRELSAASVFALVSLEENSPMGIEEAMAARVPVVASNRCGMPYMVRHGETGFLVNPGDPDDIAKWLRHVLADDEGRHNMGEKSRAIAFERFHPDVVARKTREVYYEAMHCRTTHV